MTNSKFKFRVNGQGMVLFYCGQIICEDSEFISINDQQKGLVRIAKRSLISQEELR